MSTVLTNVAVSFNHGKNSNNSSSNYAILTQYRRHYFVVNIPNETVRKYSGNDVESAIFTFGQVVTLSDNIYVRSYWTHFTSTSCPFAAGTTEDVGTNAAAYPNVTSEQPQAVHAGSKSSLNYYSVDLTKIFKYIFDTYKPEGTGTGTYGIWQRFGRSGYQTGSTTNIGNFAITITMTDGSAFVFTNGEWKRAKAACRSSGEWKQGAAQLYTGDAWQDV